MHNIRNMHALSKLWNTFKNLPFYNEKIKSFIKSNKKFRNIKLLSELPFFSKQSKKPKKLTNIQSSKELPFFPKQPKRPKRLTKYQMLQNILPFYDSVGVSRSKYAHKHYAENYNVEVTDKISLSDSLFLAKSSINDLFKDLLQEERRFKYILLALITLKRWNNAINRYDVETIYLRSEAITATNQRFNLDKAYEELKNKLDI